MAELKPRTLLQFLIDTKPSAYTTLQLELLFPNYPDIDAKLNCFVAMGIVKRFYSYNFDNEKIAHYRYETTNYDEPQ